MPTNDRKIRMYPKKLLSLTGISDNFLDFLTDEINEVAAAIFQGASGVLDSDQIELVAGATNDKFSLGLTNASKVVVGGGQIIDLSQITGAGITTDIPFEDDGSSLYYVGIKFAEVEDGIEINPRTGDPEYPSLKQSYGEVGTPDLVEDNTTYIRVRINSITEGGVDHTGRTVKAWMVDPVSGVESIAFFSGTSAYSTPNNYVDIPYSGSDGPLGQDTSSNPPSTTPADYRVFIEGASWKLVTDLRLDNDYAFIGTITSTGGVPTFSVADQQSIFVNTLDRAYDGVTGSGSGRVITVDAGSVKLRSPSGATTTGDDHNTQLQLDKLDSTDYLQIMVELLMSGDNRGIPVACLEPVSNSSNDLEVGEAVSQTGTQTVSFTRGGVDLTAADLRISKRLNFLMLENSDEAGLYLISSFTASTVDVLDPQTGAAPSVWTTGAGRVARILTPRFWVSNSQFGTSTQYDLLAGMTWTGVQGNRGEVRFVVLPEGNTDKPVVYYDNAAPDGTTDLPREAHYYEPDNVGDADAEVFAFLRPTLCAAGDTTSAKMPSAHTKSALTLKGGISSTIHPTEPGMGLKVKNDGDIYMGGLTEGAKFYRGHELHDDFIYHPDRIASPADLPKQYKLDDVAGTGDANALEGNPSGVDQGHGSLKVETGATTSNQSVFRTANFMNSKALSSAGILGYQWHVDFKFKPTYGVTSVAYAIGLDQIDQGSLNKMYIYLKFDTASDTYWTMVWGIDDATVGSQVTSITPTNDKWYWLRIEQVGVRFWQWSLGSATDTPEGGTEDVGPADGGGNEANFENNPGAWEFYVDMTTKTSAARGIIMDHLHIQDVGMPMQNSKLGNED
jgi:hypothetical protein